MGWTSVENEGARLGWLDWAGCDSIPKNLKDVPKHVLHYSGTGMCHPDSGQLIEGNICVFFYCHVAE